MFNVCDGVRNRGEDTAELCCRQFALKRAKLTKQPCSLRKLSPCGCEEMRDVVEVCFGSCNGNNARSGGNVIVEFRHFSLPSTAFVLMLANSLHVYYYALNVNSHTRLTVGGDGYGLRQRRGLTNQRVELATIGVL